MHDLQAEELLEQVEVAIAVQEDVIVANATRGDQQIDRLPHGVAALPQVPVMAGGFDGERSVVYLDDLELEQLRLNRRRFAIVAKSLQDLGQNQRGQANPITIKSEVKPLRLRIGDAVEEIDPDRRIDNDHKLTVRVRLEAARTHLVQVAFPANLAA